MFEEQIKCISGSSIVVGAADDEGGLT